MANEKKSGWFSASELIDLYELVPHRPSVIDLTGGQPDLTPEWIPWMMKELQKRRLDSSVYLWSDDNLSNDYFWRFIPPEDLEFLRTYPNYGKVCCFKGFDPISFAFNTGASPDSFERQFELFKRYIDLGIDLYAYATFTSCSSTDLPQAMAGFVDKLQRLRPNLPLRTVPLEIKSFSPMRSRMRMDHENAVRIQHEAVLQWNEELSRRFSETELHRPICEVEL